MITPLIDFQPTEATAIPVQVQDSDSASSKSEVKSSENIEPKSEENVEVNGKQEADTEVSEEPTPVTPLEMIFNSAKKGLSSLADQSELSPVRADQSEPSTTLTEVSQLDEKAAPAPPPGLDPMSLLLQNLKKQTEEKKAENPLSSLFHNPPPVTRPIPGESEAKVLIFGDETLRDLETHLNQIEYSIEIHMLEGAETKNIQKYIQESVGTKKEAQLCIFHVGTNDISGKRSESQYNTDLMLLLGACRQSFPNAKICCSSVLPRHDEFVSKVAKFNHEADTICEVCRAEFLNNTKGILHFRQLMIIL